MLRVGLISPLSLSGFLATSSEQSSSRTVPLQVALEHITQGKCNDDPSTHPHPSPPQPPVHYSLFRSIKTAFSSLCSQGRPIPSAQHTVTQTVDQQKH